MVVPAGKEKTAQVLGENGRIDYIACADGPGLNPRTGEIEDYCASSAAWMLRSCQVLPPVHPRTALRERAADQIVDANYLRTAVRGFVAPPEMVGPRVVEHVMTEQQQAEGT